jgi:hypothetical protein
VGQSRSVRGEEGNEGVVAETGGALVKARAEGVGVFDLAGVDGAGLGAEDAVVVAAEADVGEEGEREVEAAVVHVGAEGVAHLVVVDAVVEACGSVGQRHNHDRQPLA